MANSKFLNVVAKDGQTAAQRFAAMTKEAGVFYKVADTGVETHYYLEDQLISAEKAAEISVLDQAGVFDGADVETVLNELFHDAANQKIWFVDASAGQSQYAKVYEIYQGENAPDAVTDPSTLVGTINLPKDMVVEDGAVVNIVFVAADNSLHEGDASGADVTALIIPSGQTATEADAGKYIKLIIQNVTDPLYIAAQDLVDIYTGDDTAEVSVSIDANNVITATIEKISGTKIIYRAESYPQVQVGDEFDASETYYVTDGTTYTVDSTVTADNFDTKVAAGLYTHVTELNINAKVDAVEAALNQLRTYVGVIPVTSSAATVIGYVDEKTGAGVDALNGEAEIATVASNVVTLKGGIVETAGIISNSEPAKVTVVDGYLHEGKFYSDSSYTTEITPVTTSSYQDLGAATPLVYNWTGKAFVLARTDIVLEEVAMTGAAEDVSIADADGNFTATDVEGALAELAGRTSWIDV